MTFSGVIFYGSFLHQFSHFNIDTSTWSGLISHQNFRYYVFKMVLYNRLLSEIASCTYVLRA